MIKNEPRTLGYYASSPWFQWAVLFVVIGLFTIGLLSALDDAKERAERLAVELTIRNMRTGMRVAMGEALIEQREGEIATWEGSNPIRWLGGPPTGYRGECSPADRQDMSGGQWCFEKSTKQLVYRPQNEGHLREGPEGSERQCQDLSWHVVRVSEAATKGGFAGLRLEPASPCQWIFGRG